MTRITSVRFKNFKGLRDYSLALKSMNVLVGPNNSGKSTIIGAFKLLAAGLRSARSRRPGMVRDGDRTVPGWVVSTEELDVSIENVHSDLDDTTADVTFQLSNKNRLRLHFPVEGGCLLIPETDAKPVKTAATFKAAFPVSVEFVPTLGPLEDNETLVEPATVRRGLQTHRASRHFRSYWHYRLDEFDEFAEAIAASWPGMVIEPPERTSTFSAHLSMFCREEGMTRELYWVGFGFQVWCQLLTHVVRAKTATILVIDEPETYLHPDIQRQLVGLLRDLGPDIVLATHSSELMAEAEHAELLLVDKKRRSAQRLRRPDQIQQALDFLGSAQNMTLTQLARSRRLLFVEGTDFKLIRLFARLLGLTELGNGFGLVPIPIDGFGNFGRIGPMVEGIEAAVGRRMARAGVFDRDYRSAEEIRALMDDLKPVLDLAHVHGRKEIENYLLVPAALDRAISAQRRHQADAAEPVATHDAESLLMELTEPLRKEVFAQYSGERVKYMAKSGQDPSTLTLETLDRCETLWAAWEGRASLVHGKDVLGLLRAAVQERYKVSLTEHRIVEAMRAEEVAADLAEFLQALDKFRTTEPEE